MTAEPAPGKEYFTAPAHPNQRRYEALRAYFTEDLTVGKAGAGYTRSSMASLLRDFRPGAGAVRPARQPGPKTAPAKDRARARVTELRRAGLSVYEISSRLRAEGTPLNRTGSGRSSPRKASAGCCAAPPPPPAPARPPPAGTPSARAGGIDFAAFPGRAETRLAGLLLAIPDLVSLDLPALTSKAGYPAPRSSPPSPGCCPCSR